MKRKVSFPSPQNKTYYYNQDFTPARPLKFRSPFDTKAQPKKKDGKMVYKVKSLVREMTNTIAQTERLITDGSNEQEITLTVDLGPLSPMSNTLVSSPDNHTVSDILPSPTQSNILNDNLADINYEKNDDLVEIEQKASKEAFQKKNLLFG